MYAKAMLLLGRLIQSYERYRTKGAIRLAAALLVGVLFLLATYLVRYVEIDPLASTHLYYLPLVLSAFAFGTLTTLGVALASALAVAPFIPLPGALPDPQTLAPGWPVRAFGYLGVGLLAVGFAETRRALLAETSRSAEARFRDLLESAPDAMVVVDHAGIITLANRQTEQVFGYYPEELLGQPVEALLPAGLRSAHVGHRGSYLATPHARPMGVGLDLYARRKDGSEVAVEISLSPLNDDEGLQVICAVRDVTERKRAEEALSAHEKLLASIYSNVPDPLFLLSVESDDQFHFMSVNDAFLRITGLTQGQVVGRRVEEVLPESSHALVIGKYKEAIASGRPVRWEEVAVFPAGKRVGAVAVTPIQDESGVISRLVGSVRDVTAERLAQEDLAELNADLEQRVVERTTQLESANRELEAFSYSVSHDLRAPLRAIDGFSRILMEEHGPHLTEEARRYLRLVRDNAHQMGQLIDDLLTFSRLSRQPLNKQSVAPAEVARRALEDLHAEREGRQAEVAIGDLPTCRADPALLRQVYANLLSNALKFTRQRERAFIQLGWQKEADAPERWAYFVKDNGVGFDMRYADKLFEVFQRLHRSEEYEGTGVGLAIVQRIIHRHGGRVWAEAAPEQGATFYFTLEGEGPGD